MITIQLQYLGTVVEYNTIRLKYVRWGLAVLIAVRNYAFEARVSLDTCYDTRKIYI